MSKIPATKMTPQQMSDFMCEILARCRMLDGSAARSTLELSPAEVRNMAAVVDFLILIAPHRAQLINLVTGRR